MRMIHQVESFACVLGENKLFQNIQEMVLILWVQVSSPEATMFLKTFAITKPNDSIL